MFLDKFYEQHLLVVDQPHDPDSNFVKKQNDQTDNLGKRLLLLEDQA